MLWPQYLTFGFFGLSLLCSPVLFAEDWFDIAEYQQAEAQKKDAESKQPGQTVSMDMESIHTLGSNAGVQMVSLRFLPNSTTAQKITYEDWQVDCEQQEIGIAGSRVLGQDGKLLSQERWKDPLLSKPKSGSVGEQVFRILCSQPNE